MLSLCLLRLVTKYFITISGWLEYKTFIRGGMSPDPLIRGPFFLLLLLRYQKMVIIFSLDPRLLLMQNIVQSKYKPRFRNISLLLKSNQLHKKNNNIFFQADSQLLSSRNLITLDCHSFTSMTSWLSVGYIAFPWNSSNHSTHTSEKRLFICTIDE